MLKKLFYLAVVASFFVISPPVFAQRRPVGAENPEIRQQVQQAAEERKTQARDQVTDRRQELSADRCQIIEANLNRKLQNYQTGIDHRRNRHTHVIKILETLINRANQANLDTTELVSVKTTLAEKITTHQQDIEAVIEAARLLNQSSCSDSEGNFKAELENFQTMVGYAQASAAEVKNYYLNTVKPVVRALKNQVAS